VNADTDKLIFQDIFDMDEISLQDPEEEREKYKERKECDAKIHNSFTGPYPLDPTEFSHTDKGENYQFTTISKSLNYWIQWLNVMQRRIFPSYSKLFLRK